MRAAMAIWGDRIAPVFDVSRHVRLVDVEGGRVVHVEASTMPNASLVERARWLVDHGVGLLICGAISRPLQGAIAAHGIRVISFVAGDIGEIERAWLAGTLEEGPFAMPGCWGGAGMFRGRHGFRREVVAMQGRKRGAGGGAGGGRGTGGRGGGANRPGRGSGRMGGPMAGGPGGACVCPMCGHREPHERGVPCSSKRCPKCGAALTRV
jgi:predicted Fe-Mo cluster-binding NifX family protein